jgi:hypothetical protein
MKWRQHGLDEPFPNQFTPNFMALLSITVLTKQLPDRRLLSVCGDGRSDA